MVIDSKRLERNCKTRFRCLRRFLGTSRKLHGSTKIRVYKCRQASKRHHFDRQKTALIALRYGADKLPKAMRPYANKIANFLDDLQNWQEGPTITGLVALGVPYDVAEATATWVVFFAGV